MDKDLELVFELANGNKKVITVKEPAEAVDLQTVTKAMQGIIDSKVFDFNGVPLSKPVEARYRTVDVTVIEA